MASSTLDLVSIQAQGSPGISHYAAGRPRGTPLSKVELEGFTHDLVDLLVLHHGLELHSPEKRRVDECGDLLFHPFKIVARQEDGVKMLSLSAASRRLVVNRGSGKTDTAGRPGGQVDISRRTL